MNKEIDILLDEIFLNNYAYCTQHLCKQFASGTHFCSKDDAKDVFMDAMLRLRNALLKGNVEDKNRRGYLLTICKNIWLKKKAKEKKILPLDIEKVEFHLGKKEGLYNDDFNPLVKSEELIQIKKIEKQKIDAFAEAWEKLGEKCKQLLKAFYIDRLKLKDLQEKFGYGSYDSIKSMRRKCFNQLKKDSKDRLV